MAIIKKIKIRKIVFFNDKKVERREENIKEEKISQFYDSECVEVLINKC